MMSHKQITSVPIRPICERSEKLAPSFGGRGEVPTANP